MSVVVINVIYHLLFIIKNESKLMLVIDFASTAKKK